jgi:hypothetical protein
MKSNFIKVQALVYYNNVTILCADVNYQYGTLLTKVTTRNNEGSGPLYFACPEVSYLSTCGRVGIDKIINK